MSVRDISLEAKAVETLRREGVPSVVAWGTQATVDYKVRVMPQQLPQVVDHCLRLLHDGQPRSPGCVA